MNASVRMAWGPGVIRIQLMMTSVTPEPLPVKGFTLGLGQVYSSPRTMPSTSAINYRNGMEKTIFSIMISTAVTSVSPTISGFRLMVA